MALSEHEQRMLDAIEQALFADDPSFASSVDPTRIRRRRPVLSIIFFVLGIVALVVGVIFTQQILILGVSISVVGFIIMVGAVGLFIYGVPLSGGSAKKSGKRAGRANSPLSTRMEERFRRRYDQ